MKFAVGYQLPQACKEAVVDIVNTGQAVCGGRGCLRACMINLEKRGVLQNKFHAEFRRRKPWSVDWSDHTGERKDAD